MHLLAAESGAVADGGEPIDVNQTPADLVFLSSADTELAGLSAANEALEFPGISLRLAQLSWLSHPFSVDLYIEKTARQSRLVIVRSLGGRAYWSYCLEQLASRLDTTRTLLAILPGDDKPDEELFDLSSLPRHEWEMIWGYCIEGGPQNAENLLRYCDTILNDVPAPPAPQPWLRSGCYWPGNGATTLADIRPAWTAGGAIAVLVFYRALLQSGNTESIDCLIDALRQHGINPLPLFVSSLKDPLSAATISKILAEAPADIAINLTSFAVSSPGSSSRNWQTTILDAGDRMVLQAIQASLDEETWRNSEFGLPPRDLAMHLSLPEVDGRLTSRAIAFKSQFRRDKETQFPVTRHQPKQDRIEFTAALTANWLKLRCLKPRARCIALLLANYPNKDGRLANGVGLDTPASAIRVIRSMAEEGYDIGDTPTTVTEFMQILLAGPTPQKSRSGQALGCCRLGLTDYLARYQELPFAARQTIEEKWGTPKDDPLCVNGEFVVSAHRFRNLVIAVQPSRGHDLDPVATYHCPDLPPPHNYLAFYFWLRFEFGTHAIVHLGKHGNLEWLPGKAVALSNTCFPELTLGPIPNIYPFIVNDPGEGTQAKRRSQAVIIDHLTPPLTRAGTYGMLRQLEGMIDEYFAAAGLDANRVELLRKSILEAMQSAKIDEDAGIDASDDTDSRLRKLDAYLCELKESQIRDGLHVFGVSPDDEREQDLLAALARIPRENGKGGHASLLRALASDFQLGAQFDPLDCDMSAPWQNGFPSELHGVTEDPWRSCGDTVERLELYGSLLIAGRAEAPGPASRMVLEQIHQQLAIDVRKCGDQEIAALLRALDGRFVRPGPSGAPSRGRPDVLPTGRNFFSVDSRSIPTPTAWTLGWRSASLLVERHVQDHGDWPRTVTLSAWGTSNMRTGGDDIAQCLALMGVRPVWDTNNRRVTGVEAIPLGVLGRPRVDVTLRVSGFFRDAFPHQMDVVAGAAKLVMNLDEPPEENPAAQHFHSEREKFGDQRAGIRVFGAKPGAYGAGLQTMIDERVWRARRDLADSYVHWGGYAYGGGLDGQAAHQQFAERLATTEIVVQNQDNREHDLLDSDDYYQFEGGAAAAVANLRGTLPIIYHNDHSRPERPMIRTLEEEIGRVVRARVVNPKWINGVMRHGYKGAFEMAATVDYMFAFAATTGAVKSHHFDLVYAAYLNDEETRKFIAENNPPALVEMAERLNEAIERGLWRPRLNSVQNHLTRLIRSAERCSGRVEVNQSDN